MSDRGLTFANEWVSENIHADGYAPEDGPDPRVAAALSEMLQAAEAEGISREEIEEFTGELEDFIAEAIERANDNEVERLSSQDD